MRLADLQAVRAVFVTAMSLAAGLAATMAVARADQKPNILLLVSDDQRPDTIRALGNPLIHTPVLDRLVRRGTSFTRAVSPNPLCVPSRAEILTGCSGFRNGVLPGVSNRLNEDLALWPEVMQKVGYLTCYVGKWHTSGRPSGRGYQESLGLFAGSRLQTPVKHDAKGREITGYRNWVFQTDDGRLDVDQGVGLTADISARFADAAIEFIRRKPAAPFFLHVNFTAPHDPLIMPPGFADTYDPERMKLPPNFVPEHPFDHGNLHGRDERLWPWPRRADDVREELALFYAVIAHLDAQVGRILAALDATGQAENTIVVFTSDHGLAIGSHGLRGKQNMYEHTIGVPLIVAGPSIPQDQRRDAQVYLRDLFPTICELAGVDVPGDIDGRSFKDVLSGKKTSVHREVFGYFNNAQRMIRTDRWKLIHYPRIDKYQLFDLSADPYEMHNLADDDRQKATFAELRTRLNEWQSSVGDPVAVH